MRTLNDRFFLNNKGSVLVVVYLLIVVLLGFVAALGILTSHENLSARKDEQSTQAFNIAEAGIERALYDLRQDFVNDLSSPSFADGNINGMAIGPDSSNFYAVPYGATTLNNGSYSVEFKNVTGSTQAIWIKSVGTVGSTTQTLTVYAKIQNISPWGNAIFAGAGASGATVNGNVNIRGSVHILGTGLASTDYAIDLGGTAELVGNNYNGLAAALALKVPTLPTTLFNGETVSTLNAELRVKRGIIGLSGSSTVGENNVAGNSVKETVDGTYVTNGYGGNQGASSVYSDNGWSNAYDLGDAVTFPSLSDPYPGYSTYQDYLRANALVIANPSDLTKFSSLNPNSNFTYSSANGSISMDGNGNMTISGIVYIEGGALNMSKAGSNTTINYTGSGSLLVTGNVQIDVNLITTGNNSFPNNILGIMTPGNMGFNQASIDVMGLFYAEGQVRVEKQTDIMGTIVANYFDMGTNVPSIFQVPETINHLPLGLIGQNGVWLMKIVSWEKS